MPKQKLQVQPLRRAYRPKYPSYSDPNPLLFPETRPYPFSQKMVDALAQAGFAGALVLSPLAATAQSESSATPENPFSLERTHLPYVPISYGTGQPSRLRREDVVDFIHEVFVSEGLTPNKDTLFTADGVRIPASSYDESCKIGFVWLDYQSFGPGMRQQGLFNWQSSALSDEELRKRMLERQERTYQQYERAPQGFLNNLIEGRKRNRPIDQAYKQDLEEQLPQLNDPETFKQYFIQRSAAYEFSTTLDRYDDNPALAGYYDLLLRMEQEIADPLERLALSIRTSRIANLLGWNNEALKEALSKELRDIAAVQSFEDWRKRADWLVQLVHLDHSRRFFGEGHELQPLLLEVLATPVSKEREEKYQAFAQRIDEQEVSLTEAQRLEAAANDSEYFIAPISVLDNRTIYPAYFSYETPAAIAEEQAELDAKLKEAESEEEQKAIRAEMTELHRDYRETRTKEAKMLALRQLEADVRRYIQWAKAQQGY